MSGGRIPAPVYGLCVAALLAMIAAALLSLQNEPLQLAPVASGRGCKALGALLIYLALTALLLWRRRRQQAWQSRGALSDAERVWIVDASQTGTATELADQAAGMLAGGGTAVQRQALGELDGASLQQARRMLLVLSTTGEGDGPDSALRFLREVLPGRPDLSQLQYGVLALGDRNFKRYCAFGRALDSWLHECGATRMFGAIEVDNGDATALRLWRAQLASLIEEPDALSAAPAQESLRFEPWILAGREHLNPGSPGGALYRITLRPPGAAMTGWQPGDIAQLFPGSWSAIPAAEQLGPALREYSIASLPTDRQIELLVRQVRRADGSGGVGSGWLIRGAAFGAEVPLRIRSNRAFHPPALQLPLILIGNGTGLAGLRAHLKWRALHGVGRSWLLFGERSRQHDSLLDDELQQWWHSGLIEVLERVFSREGEACRYVQDALRLQATRLHEWLAAGAAIYVCGSAEGMAQGVDLTLRDLLGAEAVDELMIGGRYRRDVY